MLSDPLGALEAWRQLVVWADWIEIGPALAFATIFPLTAAVLLRLRDSGWPTAQRGLKAWSLVYAGLLLAVSGARIIEHGPGFDMRYAATLWPVVVLWTAPIVIRAMERVGTTRFVGTLSVAAATALSLTLAFVGVALTLAPRITFPGNIYDQVVAMRYAGTAMAVALAYVGCLWAVRRGRWGRAWDVLVPCALGLSLQFQVMLQLGMSRSWRSTAPFVAWPMEALHWLVHRLLFP